MRAKIFIFIGLIWLVSCETDNSIVDFGLDYQPLELGRFWLYEVDEVVVFGENDQEERSYFLRDWIEYTYFNAQNEQVFVLRREISLDRSAWETVSNYSLLIRRNSLVRFFENRNLVPFVFPPRETLTWDANVFNSQARDMFVITKVGVVESGGIAYPRAVMVVHEDDDDKITLRDVRYEVYARRIGMIEQYSEVFTYCTRNDCVGKEIINGGRMTHLKMIDYGSL
jgi:hypothetical protein